MIRKIAVVAALCALAAVSLASSATANTYIKKNSINGTTYYSGNISGSLASGTTATLSGGSAGTNISCTAATFTGSVGASGGATVSGTLSTLQFGPPCTDDIPFFNVNNCSLDSSTSSTAEATGLNTGTLTLGNVSVSCYTNLGFKLCTFTSSAPMGDLANSDNSLTFSGVSVSGSGSGCPTSATFSAKFSPIRADDGSNAPLYITTQST